MSREYTPDGNGLYTSEACSHCGSQTFIFAGEAPDCLPCFMAHEAAVLAAEKVGGGLTELLRVVRELQPQHKSVLRSDVLAWRVQLEQLLLAVQP